MPIAAFAPAIIGAGGSLLGGIFGSKGAKKSGQTVLDAGNAAAQKVTDATTAGQTSIAGATQSAQDIMKAAYGDTRAAYSPYAAAGETGVKGLLEALAPGGALSKQFAAPTGDEAAATPGYQFQLNEGLKATQRSAAAGGSLQSGGTLKALTQYSQGLASTYYQNAYNNALKTFQTNHDNTANGLMSLTNLGQFGASGLANASQNYGTNSAQNLMQGAISGANLGLAGAGKSADFGFEAAQGKAAGDLGSTNSWLNMITGLGQAGSNAASVFAAKKTPSTTTLPNPATGGYAGSIPGVNWPIPQLNPTQYRDQNGDWSYQS